MFLAFHKYKVFQIISSVSNYYLFSNGVSYKVFLVELGNLSLGHLDLSASSTLKLNQKMALIPIFRIALE
jgi:hypothetical protein